MGLDALVHGAVADCPRTRISDFCDCGTQPTKLFVGGISRRTTTKHLRKHFLKYGQILDCVAMRLPNGRPRGFGYVTVESTAVAMQVLLETHCIDEHVVDVKIAVPDSSANTSSTLTSVKSSPSREELQPCYVIPGDLAMYSVARPRSHLNVPPDAGNPCSVVCHTPPRTHATAEPKVQSCRGVDVDGLERRRDPLGEVTNILPRLGGCGDMSFECGSLGKVTAARAREVGCAKVLHPSAGSATEQLDRHLFSGGLDEIWVDEGSPVSALEGSCGHGTVLPRSVRPLKFGDGSQCARFSTQIDKNIAEYDRDAFTGSRSASYKRGGGADPLRMNFGSGLLAAHFAHQSLVSPPSNQWLCHREHLSAQTFIGTEIHDISSQCPAFVDISGRAVC